MVHFCQGLGEDEGCYSLMGRKAHGTVIRAGQGLCLPQSPQSLKGRSKWEIGQGLVLSLYSPGQSISLKKEPQAPSVMAVAIPFYSKMSLVLRCFLLAGPEERPVPEAKMLSYLWKLNKGGRGRKNTH